MIRFARSVTNNVKSHIPQLKALHSKSTPQLTVCGDQICDAQFTIHTLLYAPYCTCTWSIVLNGPVHSVWFNNACYVVHGYVRVDTFFVPVL